MRTAFSDSLVRAAERDERVLVLSGDHGYALFDPFRARFPERFLNCGVAEQNMVGVAAGLAKAGLRPVVYGLAAFVPIRVLEQIKIDVCHDALPVCFVGDGAGVVYSQLGMSHQSAEDVAALRSLPSLAIYSPADRFELTACFDAAIETGGPAYLRLGKADLGDVHAGALTPQAVAMPLDLGVTGSSVPAASLPLLLASGAGVPLAQKVARGLGGARVVSVPTLKPWRTRELLELAAPHRCIATIEEHSVHGGLGSAVAETLAGKWLGEFVRIGIQDRFTASCGSYASVMREHRLDPESVTNQLRRAFGGDSRGT
jgi:transketolase